MKINNINPNQNFGTKLKTSSVLETTSMNLFEHGDIQGIKEVYNALNNRNGKGVGHLGYKHYAKIIGDEIIKKYPVIADATNQISEFIKTNPKAKRDAIKNFATPIINNIGQEIDIII